jgi:flagellar basal-body rod protein FlgF
MIRGLYSAATAMSAIEQQHELTAENLAHANVTGFREKGVSFETFDRMLQARAPDSNVGELAGTHVFKQYTSFEGGTLQHTGNPFDVAVDGKGFFVVEGPSGPLYTRNGSFRITNTGELVTTSGMPVTGDGARITVPPTSNQITISADGSVVADGVQVGRLQMAEFENPDNLVPVGTTVFQAPPGTTPTPGNSLVLQGYVESSNVQVVHQLVNLIAGMRHYEAAQRALKAISDSVEMQTRPQ